MNRERFRLLLAAKRARRLARVNLTQPARRLARGLLAVAATAAFMPQTALAKPGDLLPLERRHVELTGPDALARLQRALDDIPGILRHYQPRLLEVSELKVEDQGPREMPRVSFWGRAKILGIVREGRVIGDTEKKPIVCGPEWLREGYRFFMHMDESDALISDNVKTYLIDLCWAEVPGRGVRVRGESSMEEGPNYGFLMGPQARRIMAGQTEAVLEALRRRFSESLE